MKNKGFTLVELITTFALSAVIIVLLINVVVAIKDLYSNTNIKTELYINQSNLSNALNSKINGNLLEGYDECTDTEFCYILNFVNGESIKLTVTETEIRFGDYVYKLLDKTKVVNPILQERSAETVETNNENSLLNINIPIISELYPGIDFGINLVYSGLPNSKSLYEESILKGSIPDLYNGTLTPVKYNGSNWVVADPYEEWYNYSNQEWANAVLLKSGVSKDVGDPVTVEESDSEALAMFVWIPRYEYKIVGTYGTHTDGTSGTANLPGEIEVKFISKNKTTADSGYNINSAFTFGDTTLSGLWVGKFETSHTTLSSNTTANVLRCSNASCSNASGLRILPNVTSIRYHNIPNFAYASLSMTMSGNPFGLSPLLTDSHMMKNSEWGAVAYLSQSKYGKYGNSLYTGVNKEIYQNKATYITGKSNGTPASSTTNTQCSYNDITDRGSGTGACGGGASTTGNIYGVYDMSGGSLEYVMGTYANSSGILSTTYNATMPAAKYYDKYVDISTETSSSSRRINYTTACNGGMCYGHALTETARWYGDNALAIYTTCPFLRRGGVYSDSTSGIFFYYDGVGGSTADRTFRVVLTKP